MLIDGILAHPAIVVDLLNGRLSSAVLDIAREHNLQVFPSSWKDFAMLCDCPDWAVPCKHIAAVIYKMSQEIDNDPFVVFELHGVDILGELKKRGVNIGNGYEKASIADWDEALQLVPQSKRNCGIVPQELQMFDFKQIVVLGDALQKLLPSEPIFYSDGNFFKLYVTNIKLLGKMADAVLCGKRYILEDQMGKDGEAVAKPSDEIGLTLSGNLQVNAHYLQSRQSKSLLDLMTYLETIPLRSLSNYSNSTYAFRMSLHLALMLAAKGNIVPMIVRFSDKGYGIVWSPYMGDRQTDGILVELDRYFSDKTVVIKGEGKRLLVPSHPAWFVTSCFLTELMGLCGKASHCLDETSAMFFQGQTALFIGVGETGIPEAIKKWISHLTPPRLRYLPKVMVREEGEDGREFLVDIGLVDTQGENSDAISLHDVFVKEKYASNRFEILRNVSLLSSLINGIDSYLAGEAATPIRMDNAHFTPFLIEMIPAMQLLNIKVVMSKSLHRLLRPLPSVSLSVNQNEGKKFLRLDHLLQFDWQVALGDQLISPEEFGSLVGRAEGLIRFKQSYIYVTAADLKRMEKVFSARNEMTPARMLQVALSEEYNNAKVSLTPEVKLLIKQWTKINEMDVPDGICAVLRPYQKRGYEWMYHNMRLGFGSILADDMGLGKTLQVITLLQKLKNEGGLEAGPCIVIAPTGLLANWQAELKRFAPRLSVYLYHGQKRRLEGFHHDILLTSYGVVRSDIDQLKKQKWTIAVIDEAQNIKNNLTVQSKAVKALQAGTHIAMSGTPVENRLSEYWSIMDFANKGYLGNAKMFNEEFGKPIQQEGDSVCATRFRRITAPMMMRRLKTDKLIISDLPDKIVQDEFAMLTTRQAALYHKVLEESMKVIESLDENDQSLLFKRQGLVLQMILALKQICNHPAQYLKNEELQPELSGKTEMLLDLVSAIEDSGEKALVFTQFKEMGDLLQRFIGDMTGRDPMFLHGGCTLKQRSEMVSRFQNNRSDRIFILSLKAAGTGLNLTAATHVIHYDLWWNPAVEAQATDRAYRIGQKKNVMVHRFITHDTFEERINEMINEKRALAEMTVTTGESWIGKLSNKELRELFG